MYKCEKCKDKLFILKGDEAIPCECRDKQIAEIMLEKSGISQGFRKKTFENFNYGLDSKILKAYTNAVTYYKDFIKQWDFKGEKDFSKVSSIMFMGQVGSGKTHLSMAIANKLLKKGIGVIYMPFRDIITQIKQNILDESYYRRYIFRYQSATVLLIDDLFKGSVSKSDINIMFEIINYRYLNHLPMIISTEHDIETLIEIDEAIGSRLIEMSRKNIIELKGKTLNYRIYRRN